ncbi:hypothetical protein D3C87_801730 [compost metagenome]
MLRTHAQQQGQADGGVAYGGEHQGTAEGGAYPYLLLGGGIPHQQRAQGDYAFGQGSAEGRQQGAGGTLGELEVMAGPFDTVDEIFAGQVDGDGREQK